MLIHKIFAWRDGRPDTLHCKVLHEFIAVMALVRLQVLGIYSFNKLASLRTVCNATCHNKHLPDISMRIYGPMYI